MDSGMIGKREKAKRYAEERGRFHFSAFTVSVDGENDSHEVGFEDGRWQCDCGFFSTRGHCSHTMALEIILEGMLAQS
jgi:hypothetical protein